MGGQDGRGAVSCSVGPSLSATPSPHQIRLYMAVDGSQYAKLDAQVMGGEALGQRARGTV